MIYMFFDNPSDRKKTVFIQKLSKHEIALIYPEQQCLSIKQMYSFCSENMKNVHHTDIVICWYDFMGVLCWWISKFKGIKCNVGALNILLKDKDSSKNKLARYLYKKALNASNFRASVTSKEYGEWLNKLLGINKKYILIHDVYHESYETVPQQIHNNTVFCGGRNGRDWKFLFKLASAMRDVTFNVVMSSHDYEGFKGSITENVLVKTDITEQEFMQTMSGSYIVVLPLDTQAPAGLIVLFQAGANSKCVITTDTVTTREYIGNDRGVLLPNDIGKWKETLYDLLSDQASCEHKGKELKTFLIKKCTEQQFVNGIDQVIESF